MSWPTNLAFFLGLLCFKALIGHGEQTPSRPAVVSPPSVTVPGGNSTALTTVVAPPDDVRLEPQSQRRVTAGMIILILACHIVMAESYGFSFRRAIDCFLGGLDLNVPEPWASALSFLSLSASFWLLKTALTRLTCERWLGFPERSTMRVRRWADACHIVLTPPVTMGIIFSSEACTLNTPDKLALSWGAFVFTLIVLMNVDACTFRLSPLTVPCGQRTLTTPCSAWQRAFDPEAWAQEKAKREEVRRIERFGPPCICTQKKAEGETESLPTRESRG